MSTVATPIFVRDIETANKLIANAKGKVVVNVFVLSHEDAIEVIDGLADRITVQPVKQFGDAEVYVEAPGQLTDEVRKKYIKRLAGEIFTTTYQGVEASVQVTDDGLFRSVELDKVFKTPSTALFKWWDGKVKGRAQVNGWHNAKNKNGNSINDEIRKYLERPDRLSSSVRKKYLPRLAGQIFTGTRKDVTITVRITKDGMFERLEPAPIALFENLSSACSFNTGNIDGYRYLKNADGQNIDEKLQIIIDND